MRTRSDVFRLLIFLHQQLQNSNSHFTIIITKKLNTWLRLGKYFGYCQKDTLLHALILNTCTLLVVESFSMNMIPRSTGLDKFINMSRYFAGITHMKRETIICENISFETVLPRGTESAPKCFYFFKAWPPSFPNFNHAVIIVIMMKEIRKHFYVSYSRALKD